MASELLALLISHEGRDALHTIISRSREMCLAASFSNRMSTFLRQNARVSDTGATSSRPGAPQAAHLVPGALGALRQRPEATRQALRGPFLLDVCQGHEVAGGDSQDVTGVLKAHIVAQHLAVGAGPRRRGGRCGAAC